MIAGGVPGMDGDRTMRVRRKGSFSTRRMAFCIETEIICSKRLPRTINGREEFVGTGAGMPREA